MLYAHHPPLVPFSIAVKGSVTPCGVIGHTSTSSMRGAIPPSSKGRPVKLSVVDDAPAVNSIVRWLP